MTLQSWAGIVSPLYGKQCYGNGLLPAIPAPCFFSVLEFEVHVFLGVGLLSVLFLLRMGRGGDDY